MEQVINAERIEQVISVFGSFDENIKKIEEAFQVRVANRGTELKVSGDDEAACSRRPAPLRLLLELWPPRARIIDEQKVRYLIEHGAHAARRTRSGRCRQGRASASRPRVSPSGPRPLDRRTMSRPSFNNTITIGVGPAGTGKTYLAVAAAVAAFRAKDGQPDHPDAARRGGGRTAGLSAGRSAEQGRPLPAPAV